MLYVSAARRPCWRSNRPDTSGGGGPAPGALVSAGGRRRLRWRRLTMWSFKAALSVSSGEVMEHQVGAAVRHCKRRGSRERFVITVQFSRTTKLSLPQVKLFSSTSTRRDDNAPHPHEGGAGHYVLTNRVVFRSPRRKRRSGSLTAGCPVCPRGVITKHRAKSTADLLPLRVTGG